MPVLTLLKILIVMLALNSSTQATCINATALLGSERFKM